MRKVANEKTRSCTSSGDSLCVGTGWLIGWGMGRDGVIYATPKADEGKKGTVLQCVMTVNVPSGQFYCLQAIDHDGRAIPLSENEMQEITCTIDKKFCFKVEVK